MTKIVVVVDENHKEIFEGENIEASVNMTALRGTAASESILTIVEKTQLGPAEVCKDIASFKHWIYWRYTA